MSGKNKVFDQNNRSLFISSKVIAEPIVEKIQQVIRKNGTVFLATSQKGVSGGYICQNCHYIPQCQRCQRVYYVKTAKILKCPLCGKEKKAPEYCPKCKNIVTKTIGLGIQKMFEEIKRLFKNNRLKILKTSNRNSNILQKNISAQGTIFLGPLKSLRVAKFNEYCGLLAILNSDKTFFIPEFTASEQKYQEIAQYFSSQYPLYLQTKYPKNETIQLAFEQNYLKFFHREIALRKEQNLPPFTKLIKFDIKNKRSDLAEKALKNLKTKLSNTGEFDFFSGVYPGYPEKIRNNYIFHLTIGFKEKQKKSRIKNPEILDYCVKNKITIDVDPIGLL